MKKILNLLFTVCAFSMLTFSYANAATGDEPEVGEQNDDSVDCIAINSGSGDSAPAQGGSDESGSTGSGKEM